MPRKRPIVGLDRRKFKVGQVEDLYIPGQFLKEDGYDVPDVVKMRGKRHYWKNPTVVDDGSSTETVLHLKGKPKVKAAHAAALAAAKAGGLMYDGYDDLTITLTWNNEEDEENTIEITYEDIEYEP